MPFNKFLAAGAGLANGISEAQAAKTEQQNKVDDEYRTMALKLHFDKELDDYKNKRKEDLVSKQMSSISNLSGVNKQNTTNQATFDAMKTAQNNPQISQETGITGEENPGPTNTPQTSVSPSAPPVPAQGQPVQNTPLQGTPSTQPQGGLNSPQGGEVTLNTPQQTPQQGDATNPLAPPNAQTGDNTNPSGGQVNPNLETDEIIDGMGNKLTREQATRASAYAMEETQKTNGSISAEAAYTIGLGKVLKDDGQLGSRIRTSGPNAGGFTIGTVPDGSTSPVLPDTFNITAQMHSDAQRDISIRKNYEQLSKDDAVAVQAAKTSTQISMYLAGNAGADTGGLQRIGFVRDAMSSLNSTDAVLDSLNKSLTFDSLGFERVPGMRITQAEFFILREAIVGRGNTEEANNTIGKFLQTKLQLPQEYAKFKQDYMTQHNGDWNEGVGQRLFMDYQKNNPIIDPKLEANPQDAKLTDFQINPNRQSMEDYARTGGYDKVLQQLGVKIPPKQAQPPAATSTSGTQEQTAPKVIGTWNPKTGKIE